MGVLASTKDGPSQQQVVINRIADFFGIEMLALSVVKLKHIMDLLRLGLAEGDD
ncbi:MAG: hypothetical protein K8R92_07550 [Planctomycetes bacterium]|nr:hypothetical protein [Planctomycetota bacterium]